MLVTTSEPSLFLFVLFYIELLKFREICGGMNYQTMSYEEEINFRLF